MIACNALKRAFKIKMPKIKAGKKKATVKKSTTDFDVVTIGGLNSLALMRTISRLNLPYNFCSIAPQNSFLIPSMYTPVMTHILEEIQLKSSSALSMVKGGATLIVDHAKHIDPIKKTVELSNGSIIKYKALLLDVGLKLNYDAIEGLKEFDLPQLDKRVFVHQLDSTLRLKSHHYIGTEQKMGNFLVYSPEASYKGEGVDFYTFIFSEYLRVNKIFQIANETAKIVYFTPRDNIFSFGPANEYALDQCKNKHIEVYLNHKLVKISKITDERMLYKFINTKTGAVTEYEALYSSITPPCTTQPILKDIGEGLLDVNPYTLQHKKYPEIFGIGDCLNIQTTKNNSTILAQLPVIKNNLIKFLEGKELNGIYDGYSQIPIYTGQNMMVEFSHTYGYKPAFLNGVVPNYGMFPKIKFRTFLQLQGIINNKMYKFSASHGPPYYFISKEYPAISQNYYLIKNNIKLN